MSWRGANDKHNSPTTELGPAVTGPARRFALNEAMENIVTALDTKSPCQACGACCAYSSNWPRFTTEDEAALDLIPEKFVNDKLSGMRCDGDRCAALSGKIGVATSCGIYSIRPEVCRTCMPGDPECGMARRRHGLPVLESISNL